MFNKKLNNKYLSLQEATKYCDYSQEYLSLRARQGKLKAVKLGRNWVTKKEWLEEYINQVEEHNKASYYISLQEATKYCSYSQEYLGLRARQGKLKAVKLGRNWVTKKEWLEEYLARVEEYNIILETRKTEKVKKAEEVRKEILPPESLPIGEPEFVPVRVELPRGFPAFRFGLVTGLVLVLIAAFGIFGKTFLQEAENIIIEGTAQSFKSFVVAIKAEKGLDILKDTLESFSEYSQWVRDKIFALAGKLKGTPRKIVQGFKSISNLWKKPERVAEEEKVPEPGEKKGMIVIPSTEEDKEMMEKIKTAFSDEVRVEPEDKASGIIIPIFREGEGEEYRYMMVPLREKN